MGKRQRKTLKGGTTKKKKKEKKVKAALRNGKNLIKQFEEHVAMAVQAKRLIRKKLKHGWEDGAPILPERRKDLEESLRSLDVLVDDYDFPGENDQIH